MRSCCVNELQLLVCGDLCVGNRRQSGMIQFSMQPNGRMHHITSKMFATGFHCMARMLSVSTVPLRTARMSDLQCKTTHDDNDPVTLRSYSTGRNLRVAVNISDLQVAHRRDGEQLRL